MPWYMWIATYLLIGSFVAFAVIPEKSIEYALGCLAVGLGSYFFIKKFPYPEEKYRDPYVNEEFIRKNKPPS